jgi:hypothetical protein
MPSPAQAGTAQANQLDPRVVGRPSNLFTNVSYLDQLLFRVFGTMWRESALWRSSRFLSRVSHLIAVPLTSRVVQEVRHETDFCAARRCFSRWT